MNQPSDWLKRPRFEPGGDDAYVHFTVLGTFAADFALRLGGRTPPEPDFRSRVQMHRLNRAEHSTYFPDDLFLRNSRADATTTRAVDAAHEAILVRAITPDPASLSYLRDAVNLVSAILDSGGTTVVHLQTIGLYARDAWERTFAEAANPAPARHVQIFTSPEAGDAQWLHTRGLRAFGRPDLSLHDVPPSLVSAATELFQRFIHWQVDGGRIAEGQAIRVAGLPEGMRCRHAGDFEDPDFNNKHVEITWGPHGSQ